MQANQGHPTLCASLHSGPVVDSGWSSRVAPCRTHCSSPDRKWTRHEWLWAGPDDLGKSALKHEKNLCKIPPGHSHHCSLSRICQSRRNPTLCTQLGKYNLIQSQRCHIRLWRTQTAKALHSSQVELKLVPPHPDPHYPPGTQSALPHHYLPDLGWRNITGYHQNTEDIISHAIEWPHPIVSCTCYKGDAMAWPLPGPHINDGASHAKWGRTILKQWNDMRS